jgi:hypothetical protein
MPNQLKAAVRRLPLAPHAYALLRLLRGRNARFAADYTRNSGAGSDLDATRAIVEALPRVLEILSVRSMLDIPCGDFLWMRKVELGDITYTGGDIIETLILEHQAAHASARRDFRILDIVTSDLPKVDLIFSRDCLVHFSHRLVRKALKNIKRSKSRYLLTTTFSDRSVNTGIITGHWQPLNLCAPPFNFPPPIRVLNEGHPAPFEDKSLGLWRIQDLPES